MRRAAGDQGTLAGVTHGPARRRRPRHAQQKREPLPVAGSRFRPTGLASASWRSRAHCALCLAATVGLAEGVAAQGATASGSARWECERESQRWCMQRHIVCPSHGCARALLGPAHSHIPVPTQAQAHAHAQRDGGDGAETGRSVGGRSEACAPSEAAVPGRPNRRGAAKCHAGVVCPRGPPRQLGPARRPHSEGVAHSLATTLLTMELRSSMRAPAPMTEPMEKDTPAGTPNWGRTLTPAR